MVCLRNICINTLHKEEEEEDDDDDNNNNNNGRISNSLRQYLSKVLGKHEIKELHKTATLHTAHIQFPCKSTKCI